MSSRQEDVIETLEYDIVALAEPNPSTSGK